MKLSKKNMILLSFTLFSLFFGAGNLIFPPFLGQMAGDRALVAFLGLLITAVVLPAMGILAVAEYDGVDKLAGRVHPWFSVVFTVAIYLSIGPGLAIPRAASVPFEMSIAPYMPEGTNLTLFMLLYSLVFFAAACWLSLNPGKLMDRIGMILTPALLLLIAVLFFTFLFLGEKSVAPAQGGYQDMALVTGFLEGYNTMDAIAALNFGLVVATTLKSLHVEEKRDIIRYSAKAGVLAGTILALIYGALAYLGSRSSGLYPLQDNGAWTLRCIVKQMLGGPGAVLLAAIFFLACLTTCVGLITSTAQYFSTLVKRISYTGWVLIITLFSFLVCNQGLNTILSISVPVLNALYPVVITLIVLGVCHRWLENSRYMFPVTVGSVTVVSVLYALFQLGVPMGFVHEVMAALPLYKLGMGWAPVALAAAALSLVLDRALPGAAPRTCAGQE